MTPPQAQIAILDAGGQYCHLIARKIRELGVYAEVLPSDTPAPHLASRPGIIISGGPASVYAPDSPSVDPAIFRSGAAVLGICYGQQLMAHLLGGRVAAGERGEYGPATLQVLRPDRLFRHTPPRQRVWMSHRDLVVEVPSGFSILASTGSCPIAALGDPVRRLWGVQFHPEVAHTEAGRQILENFVFDICGCRRDWSVRGRVAQLEAEIRDAVGDRNVFFFVSGGVDSTVAYTLCLRALGPERVSAFYVDTGLMRAQETEYVRSLFQSLGAEAFMVEEAGPQFLSALAGVTDPETKRHIIGEQFIAVQDRILKTGHFLDAQWILGQGTIYPDTIESGGSAKADVIKTHHNRVAGIQRLLAEGRVIEPLRFLYKDEVRQLGAELGLPNEFLRRHPFPGPGLAIRCLCARRRTAVERAPNGFLIPVYSVGVQGDSRTYRPILATENPELAQEAAELINRDTRINRVALLLGSAYPLNSFSVFPAQLSAQRLEVLRTADAIVRSLSASCGFDDRVWQFPVILIPAGVQDAPDSVVLRPVTSVDGMTADVVPLPAPLAGELTHRLLALPGIAAVFCDLTPKPPGTIEWE